MSQLKRLAATVILLVCLFRPALTQEKATVFGVVRDMDTGKPVPQALVVLEEPKGAVLADSVGEFEFRIRYQEILRLQVRRPGYHTQWMSIRLNPSERLKLLIDLEPRGLPLIRSEAGGTRVESAPEAIVWLSPEPISCPSGEGIIAGGVLDRETGGPVPLANVFLRGTFRGTSTDSLGQFRIAVPAGRSLILVFSHIGYVKEWYNVEVGERRQLNVELELTPCVSAMNEVTVLGTMEPLESTAATVLGEREIERMAPMDFEEVVLRLLPNLRWRGALDAYSQRPGFVLYVDGMPWEPEYLNHVDPYSVQKVVIFRSSMAPVFYRTEGARYVVDVRTR